MTTPQSEDDTLDELGAVADELLEQAAALRRRWEELGDVLGVDLGAERAAVEDAAVPVQPPARRALDDDAVRTEVAVRAGYAATESPDPLRVVVFDMMLSGRSRKEVKDYVRSSFGSAADLAVVDELFDSH